MTKNRINIKDVISDEFYQLPKLFFWDKKYREDTSPGAKLLYMLVKDRFNLSLYTTKQENNNENTPTYTDQDGDIYCILDNQEIEFTLNTTTKTVIKWMNELEKLDLVETEETEGGANRIYLNKLDSSGATLATFLGQRDFYKHVKSRKKKKKEPTKTEEQCIEDWEKKFNKSYPQVKKEGGNNATPRGGKSTPLGDGEIPDLGAGEIPPPGDGDCPPLGEEKVHPNNTYALDLDLSLIDSNENEPSSITKSSSNENNRVKPEEDLGKIIINVSNNYSLLDTFPGIQEIAVNRKGLNVIKKTLIESKIEAFYGLDVAKALASHPLNKKQYQSKGERIKYEPVFFANNLVDHIISNAADRNARSELADKRKKREEERERLMNNLPTYNWLEN